MHSTGIHVTTSALDDIVRLLGEHENGSYDRFAKSFRAVAPRWSDLVVPQHDEQLLRHWALALFGAHGLAKYQAYRLGQLREGKFTYWVYRAELAGEECAHHRRFDRVALPPAHPFWDLFFPANSWGCRCYVVGARSESGILRVGGDPSLGLPPDWNAVDVSTGLPGGITPGFAGTVHPTIADCLAALQSGSMPLDK